MRFATLRSPFLSKTPGYSRIQASNIVLRDTRAEAKVYETDTVNWFRLLRNVSNRRGTSVIPRVEDILQHNTPDIMR